MSVTSEVPADIVFVPGAAAVAGRAGTVTAMGVQSGVIDEGEVIVTVDLRPVVAIEGTVPAFRELSVGTRGPDVQQLRAFLGLDDGDYFDESTRAAVRSWQETVGFPPDGVVARGDVLFVPELPVRGYAGDGILVGATVSVGQQLVLTVRARPSILIPADGSGGGLAPGMTARATLGTGDEVVGVLGDVMQREDGLLAYPVVDDEGLSVCDLTCADAFPIRGAPQADVTVELAPATEGIVVPESALAVLPDGGLAVREPDGAQLPVTIVVRGQGMAVVDGIEEGTVVDLFGEGSAE